MKTLFLFLISIILCSCSVIKVAPPLRKPYDPPITTNKLSSVAFRASVAQSDVVNALKNEVKNPIVPDKPISVVANIKAIETITEDKLVKKIIKPYEPGHWIDVSTRTFNTVKEAYSCWLKPWKWGKCWKDVVKEVWVTTKVWIEPQLEVFEWLAVTVITELDKVYKHEVKIHYPTDLTDFDITFNGNAFEASADFTTRLAFDYDQQLIPLGPTLKLKSVVKANISSRVKVNGTINIVAPGKIQVVMDQSATAFSFGSFSPDLPVLDGNTIDRLLFPLIANVVKPLTEKFAEKAIYKAMTKAIDHNEDNLDFRAQLNDFAISLADPKLLTENLWLNVSPNRLLSGQLNGSGKRIFYSAALEFKPFVEYSPIIPTAQPNDVPFIAGETFNEISTLDLRFQVKLETISKLLKAELNTYISGQSTISRFIRIGKVELFKTDGDRLAMRIEVERKRLAGNWTFFANAYVTNKVVYNPTGHFAFEDIAFTIETRRALTGSIISALLDEPVEKLLRDNSIYSIRDEMRIANSVIRDTTIALSYGAIKLQFAPISISNPYVTDQNLEVNTGFEGKISFDYIPKDQQPLYAPTFNGDQLIAKQNNVGTIGLQRSGNIITNDDLQQELTSAESRSYVRFERIDYLVQDTSDIALPIMPNLGDTIFTEVSGGFVQHIVGFEDLPSTNEFLVSVKPGKIERVRVDASKKFNNGLKTNLSHKTMMMSTSRVVRPVIAIQDAFKHIDDTVIVRGPLACMKQYTANSGEKILKLFMTACDYSDVTVYVYLDSVTDGLPDESYLNQQIDIEAVIDFESGKPTIKIKNNGKIKLSP